MIKGLFGILVTVSVNVIKIVILVKIMKIDYENCKCRKKLVDQIIDECTETIEEVKLANITLAENENSYYKCSSCKVYIVFMIVVFTIFTGITIYFVYYNWYLIKNVFCIKFNTCKETNIW